MTARNTAAVDRVDTTFGRYVCTKRLSVRSYSASEPIIFLLLSQWSNGWAKGIIYYNTLNTHLRLRKTHCLAYTSEFKTVSNFQTSQHSKIVMKIKISTHLSLRHLRHGFQEGSGNPTAQKTYINHFYYRKLQTCLSPSIHSENTWMSCLQPGLIISFTEQQTGR